MTRAIPTPPEPLPPITPAPDAESGPYTLAACADDYADGAEWRTIIDEAAHQESE